MSPALMYSCARATAASKRSFASVASGLPAGFFGASRSSARRGGPVSRAISASTRAIAAS